MLFTAPAAATAQPPERPEPVPPRPLPAMPIRAEVGKAATAGNTGEDAANNAATAKSCRPSTSDSRSTPETPSPGRSIAALARDMSCSWEQCSLLRAAAQSDFLTKSLDDCIGWEHSRSLLDLPKLAIGDRTWPACHHFIGRCRCPWNCSGTPRTTRCRCEGCVGRRRRDGLRPAWTRRPGFRLDPHICPSISPVGSGRYAPTLLGIARS